MKQIVFAYLPRGNIFNSAEVLDKKNLMGWGRFSAIDLYDMSPIGNGQYRSIGCNRKIGLTASVGMLVKTIKTAKIGHTSANHLKIKLIIPIKVTDGTNPWRRFR